MTSQKLRRIIADEERDARGGVEGRAFDRLVEYTRSLENELHAAQTAVTNIIGLVKRGQSEGAKRISSEYWAGWKARCEAKKS